MHLLPVCGFFSVIKPFNRLNIEEGGKTVVILNKHSIKSKKHFCTCYHSYQGAFLWLQRKWAPLFGIILRSAVGARVAEEVFLRGRTHDWKSLLYRESHWVPH